MTEDEVRSLIDEHLADRSSPSQQPQALATISTNILVFSGLLVAGSLSFVAAPSFANSGLFVKATAIVLLVVSLLSGVLAIIGNLYAHNLLRRQEWTQALIEEWQNEKKSNEGKDPIKAARETAVDFAEHAHIAAISAAAIVVLLAALVVFHQSPQPEATEFSVVDIDGARTIIVDGNTEQISLFGDEDGCQYEIRADEATFVVKLDAPCTTENERS